MALLAILILLPTLVSPHPSSSPSLPPLTPHHSQYLTTHISNNLWLHPLSQYPGPLLWRAFRFPSLLSMMRGDLPHRIKQLHEQYGDIVRVAPDELSIISPDAWRDIYTRGRDFVRPSQYKDQPPGKTASNLIACSESEHARLRKILAPGFSEKSAADQEPFIQSYVDKLFSKLDEQIDSSPTPSPSAPSTTIDLVEWINYLAFDLIADLTWGSSFGCLDGLTYHPWIQTVGQFKAAIIVGALKFYPALHALLMAITPSSALQPVMDMWRLTEQNVRRRASQSHPSPSPSLSRPDLVGTMLASAQMTPEEMEVNAMLIVAAGSESITTVLVGVINHLLRCPDTLSTLVTTLRSTFPREEDIVGSNLKSIPYLDAVLNEGMRLCPTIPDGMRRQVPPGGATVAGHPLPAGVIVSIPPFATYRAPRNFVHPADFAPERWLGGERFGNERKDGFHPFSLGAHNCPGQNLAWLELRVILARLCWRYDLGVLDGAELPVWEE
ncbi:cytochrome P450 ClCP1 [Aspergillus heteromorphus CBS 117.55]|uniref:Cytochrome P450 ClCP1 n=1 Tax=Aspergillus heteromorphus CBS 117.55 TaxID=1448321 RepID=A0A317VK24_9EURO|nr:cytochrome P450 ClCP1 [Aspergillus heteromorphus CBS 117.55]PWY74295.1 cytochrome P450 ClCP1 [Aspergillus heteromorphus CBS 117.55]